WWKPASAIDGSFRVRAVVGSVRPVPRDGATSEPLPQAGDGREDLLEPLQGPDVAVARRRLAQAEHLRGLVVGQVLEVAEGQDLAVDRVHVVERLLDDQLVLDADGRL